MSDCSPELGPFIETENDDARRLRIGRARVHQKTGDPMCTECAVGWSWKNHRDYLKRKARKAETQS